MYRAQGQSVEVAEPDHCPRTDRMWEPARVAEAEAERMYRAQGQSVEVAEPDHCPRTDRMWEPVRASVASARLIRREEREAKLVRLVLKILSISSVGYSRFPLWAREAICHHQEQPGLVLSRVLQVQKQGLPVRVGVG